MQRFAFLFFVLGIIWVSIAPPAALAQKTEMDAMVSEMAVSFPTPHPRVIHRDLTGDMWVETKSTPPPNPFSMGSRSTRSIMDLASIQAKSNGVETALVLEFTKNTDMNRIRSEMVGSIYFDTDQNLDSGFNVRMQSQDGTMEFEPEIGVDAELHFFDFPRSGNAILAYFSGNEPSRRVPVEMRGNSLYMVIPNDHINEFGDGEMDLAVAIGDSKGIVDTAPNFGFTTATSLRKARISPGSSAFASSQSFDLAVLVEADRPETPFQKLVFFDGAEVSSQFASGETVLKIQTTQYTSPRRWHTVREGKGFLYHVPAGSMESGYHTVTVFVIGEDGIAADKTEYNILPTQVEGFVLPPLPPLPPPPPSVPTVN